MSTDDSHLKPYGYAPGDYMGGKCRTCGVRWDSQDKLSWTCRKCAEEMHARATAMRDVLQTSRSALIAAYGCYPLPTSSDQKSAAVRSALEKIDAALSATPAAAAEIAQPATPTLEEMLSRVTPGNRHALAFEAGSLPPQRC